MKRLSTAASKVRQDLEAELRTIGREVGVGVLQALRERSPEDEPGWRAERLAIGAMRGIDEGLADDHFHRTVAQAIERAVDAAFSRARRRSPELQELSESAARAFARGALRELRAELGATGDGPLTRSLEASLRRVVIGGATALGRPVVLVAVAAGVGLLSALLLRRLGHV